MINNSGKRILHAIKRPSQAFSNTFAKIVLKVFFPNFNLRTELNYISTSDFKTKIINRVNLFDPLNLRFETPEGPLEHFFSRREVVTVSNVLVNVDTGLIYISANNKNRKLALKESVEWPLDRALIFSKQPTTNMKLIFDSTLAGIGNEGFYHAMSEGLPSALMLNGDGYQLNSKFSKKIVTELLSGQNSHQRFGTGWVGSNEHTFVSKGNDVGYLHPGNAKIIREYAKSKLDSTLNSNISKIYVSRNNSRRSIPREKDIENIFRDAGFTIIYAEKLTISEQINIFSNAKIIAGPHGAGLFNSIWAQNCKVLELMPIERINRCFEWQCLVLGQDYKKIYFKNYRSDNSDLFRQISKELNS